ncbi:hypothetical protein JKF63_03458 [Porcisia hertigi]|uniref:C2H2-type domain-containing protein n=1 Tax=Porcisia hertigi TaxID=2761500 RepID=A0A836ILD9_9TRYP|nr:hypothetical protein JKF63_03458 [Porcisia hertigi]
MSRHIYVTRHGAVKCPICEIYIVPRGFFASLTKLIERHRDRETSATAATASPPHCSSSTSAVASTHNEGAGPLTSIAISHTHCIGLPNFRSYEKADFELPGVAEDYSLPCDSTTGRQGGSASTVLVTGGSDDTGCSPPPFRCMECLNPCATWTKATKHMDKSGHTLPLCVQCLMRLRCFGPHRPMKHEESTGHCGFYGVFYTRRDYLCEVQEPRSAYDYSTSYTGLSTLQYKCVCGISFLYPLQLAEHLRRVHRATCIKNEGVCRHCEKRGTLLEMMVHLRQGCPATATTIGSSLLVTETTTSSMASSSARFRSITSLRADSVVSRDHNDVGGGGTSASSREHVVASPPMIDVVGFSGASFLQWRPLLPPITDDDVPLMNESYAMSGDILGLSAFAPRPPSLPTSVGTTDTRKASYVVLYQCRECLFLFSSWDCMVSHIHATGHCSTYCCKCKCDLPQLVNHPIPHETSGMSRSSAPQPDSAPAGTSAPLLVRSITLSDHLAHLRRCGDIIGFPTSPRSLEVLVDVNAECYQGSLDPPPELFTGDRVVMAYQCPADQLGCYEVFLNYGNLVEHLMTTGHGSNPPEEGAQGADIASAMGKLTSCYPMVTYRAKFTVIQLRDLFGFVQCSYCESAVPRGEEELHEALCIMCRRMEP